MTSAISRSEVEGMTTPSPTRRRRPSAWTILVAVLYLTPTFAMAVTGDWVGVGIVVVLLALLCGLSLLGDLALYMEKDHLRQLQREAQ